MNIDRLKPVISPIVSLTDNEWLQLVGFVETRTLKKNKMLLSEGQVCDSIAYICCGSLIYFKALENGNDITTDFAFEGEWVTDNYSRLNNTPSLINIKATDDCELIIIKQKDLSRIFEQIPKLEKLGRILMEQAFIKISQHSIDLQVLSARDRYLKMLQKYPAVFQQMPLYHIANYLGIAPKSLSRIRKEFPPKP